MRRTRRTYEKIKNRIEIFDFNLKYDPHYEINGDFIWKLKK